MDTKALEKSLKALDVCKLPSSTYAYYHMLTNLNLDIHSGINSYLDRQKFQGGIHSLIAGKDVLHAIDCRGIAAANKSKGITGGRLLDRNLFGSGVKLNKWKVNIEHLLQYIIMVSEENYVNILSRIYLIYKFICNRM